MRFQTHIIGGGGPSKGTVQGHHFPLSKTAMPILLGDGSPRCGDGQLWEPGLRQTFESQHPWQGRLKSVLPLEAQQSVHVCRSWSGTFQCLEQSLEHRAFSVNTCEMKEQMIAPSLTFEISVITNKKQKTRVHLGCPPSLHGQRETPVLLIPLGDDSFLLNVLPFLPCFSFNSCMSLSLLLRIQVTLFPLLFPNHHPCHFPFSLPLVKKNCLPEMWLRGNQRKCHPRPWGIS